MIQRIIISRMLWTSPLDEKKQYDPSGFREAILEGLNEAGGDLEAVSKFLDSASSKLDYRRYGVALIEILIAGGLLGELPVEFAVDIKPLNRNLLFCSVAPGGTIVQDGDGVCKTKVCLFGMANGEMEKIKAWEQVFIKLVRRYETQ